jgi:hypothetical protein
MDFSNYHDNQQILGANLSYSNVIIKPPEKAVTHSNKYKTLVIDSSNRDKTKYPDPNNYKMEFSEDYRNVTSMELIYGSIPNDYFNINCANQSKKILGNNIFYIKLNDGILRNYEIYEGHYNIQYLIDTLNGKYGNLFDENKYLSFVYNNFNQKVMIYNTENFIYNLNYDIDCNHFNSIDKVLGFKSVEYYSNLIDLEFDNINMTYINDSENNEKYNFKKSFILRNLTYNYDGKTYNNPTNFLKNNVYINITYNDGVNNNSVVAQVFYVNNCTLILSFCENPPDETLNNVLLNINYYYVTGSNSVNLENYLVLEIPEFHTLDSVNDNVEKSFMVFPPFKLNEFVRGNSPVNEGNIKYFSPPKDRIQSMKIRFKDNNGSTINFNGKDHFLVFKVTLLNQPGKYNEYNP